MYTYICFYFMCIHTYVYPFFTWPKRDHNHFDVYLKVEDTIGVQYFDAATGTSVADLLTVLQTVQEQLEILQYNLAVHLSPAAASLPRHHHLSLQGSDAGTTAVSLVACRLLACAAGSSFLARA